MRSWGRPYLRCGCRSDGARGALISGSPATSCSTCAWCRLRWCTTGACAPCSTGATQQAAAMPASEGPSLKEIPWDSQPQLCTAANSSGVLLRAAEAKIFAHSGAVSSTPCPPGATLQADVMQGSEPTIAGNSRLQLIAPAAAQTLFCPHQRCRKQAQQICRGKGAGFWLMYCRGLRTLLASRLSAGGCHASL